MATSPIIGLLSAGAMGAAVAHRLTAHGYTVLTCLAGRSPASRARAAAAQMQDVGLEELAHRAHYILSILPPSEALPLARLVAPLLHGPAPPVFADCNAVAPATVRAIAALFPAGVFVDAGIIGGPPSAPGAARAYDPTLYASGERGTVEGFAGVLRKGGLKVTALEAGVGDASALKMGYAGISKGLTGLTAAMVLATHAASPATATALMHELALSQPLLLQRAAWSVPDMLPKAYRFVGEMEEIRDFVDGGVPGGTAEIWEGLARVFERVAASVREGGADAKVLEEFVEGGKATLKEREGGKGASQSLGL